jgi:hypothetical protein
MFDKLFWKKLRHIARASSVAGPLVAIPVIVMAAVVGPSVPVNVDGTVSSGTENVGFAGQLTISTRIIDDPDFKAPTILELSIDFSNVRGQGKASGRKFGTEAQTVIHRPLLAFDSFELTFPYTQGNDVHAARSATVSIDVTYNARSGIGVTSKVTKTSANGSSS